MIKTAGAGPVAVGAGLAEAAEVVDAAADGEAVELAGVGVELGVETAAGVELCAGVAVVVAVAVAVGTVSVIEGRLIVEEEQPAKIIGIAIKAAKAHSLILPNIILII
jgi:hypothetical protein